MKNNKFAGAIWTDHALEKLKKRLIPKDFAIKAFKDPDSKYESKGGLRYIKKIDDKTITVVAKANEKGEWVIISVWMEPPADGTEDQRQKMHYKEFKKASVGKKIWMSVLKQLGI